MIEGKTKILTESPDDPNLLLMYTKNSLTANDGEMQRKFDKIGEYKTIHNCGVMELLKKHHVPVAYVNSHWYEGVADSTHKSISVVNKCRMLPLECVTRRRPYGSYLKRYPDLRYAKQQSRVMTLDEGAERTRQVFNPPLTEFFHKYTVVMPCTVHRNQMAINTQTRLVPENKAREWFTDAHTGAWNHEIYTDPVIEMGVEGEEWSLFPAKLPRDQQLSEYQHNRAPRLMTIPQVVNQATIREIETLMRTSFSVLEKAWKQHDINLIDLKIEVGYQEKDKQLVIADVIDNDSWRIWPHGDPKNQLDKQSFREGEENDAVVEKYRQVAEYTKKF